MKKKIGTLLKYWQKKVRMVHWWYLLHRLARLLLHWLMILPPLLTDLMLIWINMLIFFRKPRCLKLWKLISHFRIFENREMVKPGCFCVSHVTTKFYISPVLLACLQFTYSMFLCACILNYTFKHCPFRRQILYWIDACIIKMIQMKLEWIKFQKSGLGIGYVWYMQ